MLAGTLVQLGRRTIDQEFCCQLRESQDLKLIISSRDLNPWGEANSNQPLTEVCIWPVCAKMCRELIASRTISSSKVLIVHGHVHARVPNQNGFRPRILNCFSL